MDEEDVILRVLKSNTSDQTMYDAVSDLAYHTEQVANAIMPQELHALEDASGGEVLCLAEAVMGVTAGLFAIAKAIEGMRDSPAPDTECEE